FTTAHPSPIPRVLFPAGKAARVLLERQAIMADPAVPEWVPDFPPVRSARIIFAKAQDAARAWEQPVTPGEMLTIGKDLGSALGNTGAALARLAVYHAAYQAPAHEWFRRYDDPDEPNIYIECAARALDFAGRDMNFALSGHITRSGQPSSPALSAGARLAEAARAAYVMIERPSGSAAGRDVAVSAFMAAAGALDAAVANLAAHASAPMPAILARQRVRLEQARIALRESLAASAAGKDVSGGLAAAQSMRERQPILSHRPRPATDAHGDAATLAIAGFPQPALGPAGAPTRLPAAQPSPFRLRVPARRPGTDGALP
ncbi:MAG: hypothetical protein ACRDRJ_39605, partial [Streptosporangiaceae bacterium]